jgi:hypothetical protein
MVLEKFFLIGQSQIRTVYSGHGNFVQGKWFQRIGRKWDLWKVFYHGEVFLEIDQGAVLAVIVW